MIFGGSHEKTMTLNPPCQPHCKVAGWGCSEAVGHPVGDGRAIREPGFHSVGVYVVAEGKQFLRVIMVEILISFHLNSSFNDFEIWFLTRWGLFFLSLESPNRTTLHRNCSRCCLRPGDSSAFAGYRTAFWWTLTPDTATFAAGWASLRCSTWRTWHRRHWVEPALPNAQHTSLPDSRCPPDNRPDG